MNNLPLTFFYPKFVFKIIDLMIQEKYSQAKFVSELLNFHFYTPPLTITLLISGNSVQLIQMTITLLISIKKKYKICAQIQAPNVYFQKYSSCV